MADMFVETDKVIIPSLPSISELKGNSKYRKLKHDFVCKWNGHWLLVKHGFLFNGACVPGIGRGFLGNPFAPEWLSGSVMGDAADRGDVFLVDSDQAVSNWINSNLEIPECHRKPVWFPPDMAHQLFKDLTVSSVLLLWWKAKVALCVIRIWHRVFEKPGVPKEVWNSTWHIKLGHHDGCMRYHNRKSQPCTELCDRFFAQG